MRKYAEKIKLDFYSIQDVKKVELVGVQPEKIFVQMQTDKLAQLGLDINSIATTTLADSVAGNLVLERHGDNADAGTGVAGDFIYLRQQ